MHKQERKVHMQQYIRTFMPLENETSGYEHMGKSPSGRVLIESRGGQGKLTLWVQDLKVEAIYKVHLIFKSESGFSGLPLCPLNVQANGKAELRHSFDAANIGGFGLSIDECLAVAIIATGASGTTAPLCGYKDGKPLAWRGGFKRLEKEAEKKEEKVVERKVVEKKVVEMKAEKVEKEVIEEAPPLEPQLLPVESPEPEPEPEPVKEIPPTSPLAIEVESSISQTFRNEAENIFKTHTQMKPFLKQKRDVKWIRISPHEELDFPKTIKEQLNKPFVEKAYSQYNHLIFGKTIDDQELKYYIGIPATYDADDEMQGYKQFKIKTGAKAKAGDYGYWLIFV